MGCSLSRPRAVSISVPPAPATLLSSPRETYLVQRPPDRAADSPLATIYRIYWAIVMDDTFAMRNAIEYFWNRKENDWLVNNIPKPPDQDPERFAIISAIPYVLVAAFNLLIELGLPRDAAGGFLTSEELENLNSRSKVFETVPQWAQGAPPLATPLRLPTKDLGTPETEEQADPCLAKKNVLVHRLHIYFT